jgi:hypothetical protein
LALQARRLELGRDLIVAELQADKPERIDGHCAGGIWQEDDVGVVDSLEVRHALVQLIQEGLKP